MKSKDLRYLRDKYFEEESYAECMEKCADLVNECAPEINFDDIFKQGLCHLKLQEDARAAECFAKALQIEPDNALAMSNEGICLYNLGKTADAFRVFAKALKIKPDNLPVWHYLSLHLVKAFYESKSRADKEKLVNCLRHMLSIDSSVESLPIYDPLSDRELSMAEFVLLNSDVPQLSVDEITAL